MIFLDKYNPNIFKSQTHLLFKIILAIRATITSKRAKLNIRTWLDAKFFSTSLTFYYLRWTSAFFRTIVPIKMFLADKGLTASIASLVFRKLCSTLHAAYFITVGYSLGNIECLTANRAEFLNCSKVLLTLARAKATTSMIFIKCRCKIKGFMTTFTNMYVSHSFSLLWCEFHFLISHRHIDIVSQLVSHA
jgi:hypothetical protein